MPKSSVTPFVRVLRDEEDAQWDTFVLNSPRATFFHLSGWRRLIEGTFGFPTYYLLAEHGSSVAGVLPLTHVKSRLFGNRLVSNAFAMYGGPITANEVVRIALEAEAKRLMEKLGVPVLEFRSVRAEREGWATRAELYVTFRRPLYPTV